MEKIFKWFTDMAQSDKSEVYITWFSSHFEPENFDGIDKLFAAYIKYCAYLSVPAKRDFFNAFLRIDGKRIIKEYNIKVDGMNSYDYNESSQLEEAYLTIVNIAQSTYERYMEVDLTDKDFRIDMYEYISLRKSDMIQKIMMESFPRLSDGSDITEVSTDMQIKLAQIEEVWTTESINDISYMKSKDEKEVKIEFICKTGVPCIDGPDGPGGLYTRLIYSFNGQPGAGKSRFTYTQFCYKVLTEAKKDVLVYSLELSESQVKNVLIAYHITRLYAGRLKIPDSFMNKDEMTEEQRRIYESAKTDLFESGKYGHLEVKSELIVETYEKELISYMKMHPDCRWVEIDYAGEVHSKPVSKYDRVLPKYEQITAAYEITKRVQLKKIFHFGCCIVNQYNDEGITAAYAGKPIRPGFVQGGHIVQRHADVDISMTMTDEQEAAGLRALTTTKNRGEAGFKNVLFEADLSVSIFRQIQQGAR